MTALVANGYRIGDRYTLLGKLGEGGESEVWRARDHLHGQEVALKVLRPEIARTQASWEALERQHEISRQLDHPLVLSVDPPVREGEMVMLPMELAPGGDLRRLCGVSYLEIVPVLMEVAQALAHAHERGVVHRDLKPGNVLFDARGHVRLADFGAAPSALSPFTASPQQLRGEPATAADDIYGLGALAYELLCGHPPFYPRFDRRRVLEEPVPQLKPAHLAPGRLVALVMAMLAKQPRERPASMKEVLETFEMALNDTLTFAYDDTRDALGPRHGMLPVQEEEEAEPEALPSTPERPAMAEPSAPPERPPERRTAPPPRRPLITPAGQGAGSGAHSAEPAVAFREPVREPAARAPAVPPASPASPASAPSPPPRAAPPAAAAASAPSAAPAPSPAPSSAPPHFAAPQFEPSMAAAAPAPPLRAERRPDPDLRALWGDIRVERMPNLMKLEPVRHARWPWALGAVLLAAVAAVFVLLHGSQGERSWVRPSADEVRAALAPPAVVKAVRGAVEAPLRAIQGGSPAPHTPPATAPSGESPPAQSDASPSTASASRTPAGQPGTNQPPLDQPRTDRPRTTVRVPAPVRPPALVAGRSGSAPARVAAAPSTSRSAADASAQRSRPNPGVQSLLADAHAAETARDYSRAAQDYSQALALDPRNAAARAGLERVNDAFGAGEYSLAVGSGFAALGAGRLEEAREDFLRARRVDPHGGEAALGLRQVAAALKTRDAASARYRARSNLVSRLQALVDDPQRLNSAAVRAEAASLIREAEGMPASGAVLRSLASRLAILLPAYNKPVHLALVSDNLTQIAIPEIGSFGTFARRDIDLKPGKYTVIGTRAGYQEVRRDVTVAPGQDVQTISIRCEVPI